MCSRHSFVRYSFVSLTYVTHFVTFDSINKGSASLGPVTLTLKIQVMCECSYDFFLFLLFHIQMHILLHQNNCKFILQTKKEFSTFHMVMYEQNQTVLTSFMPQTPRIIRARIVSQSLNRWNVKYFLVQLLIFAFFLYCFTKNVSLNKKVQGLWLVRTQNSCTHRVHLSIFCFVWKYSSTLTTMLLVYVHFYGILLLFVNFIVLYFVVLVSVR